MGSSNLLPEALLPLYQETLRARLGPHAWQRRLTKERQLNSTGRLAWIRAVHRTIHLSSMGLIWLVLTLLRKREIAQENCFKPDTTQRSIQVSRMGNSPPLCILHLSDFHLDTRLEQADHWAARLAGLKADLCVITGDFLNGFQLPTPASFGALKTIIDAIPIPTFGVLGNHDCSLSVPYLESLGVRMLLNESTRLQIGGRTIAITGLDDPHFFKGDDLDHALRGEDAAPRADLRLLLVHAPKDPIAYAAAGFDLCLCGHTHGGQLCTQSGTPLLRNGRYRSDTIAGQWQQGPMAGFTSRGTGTGRLAYRLHCPPEIALLQVSGEAHPLPSNNH